MSIVKDVLHKDFGHDKSSNQQSHLSFSYLNFSTKFRGVVLKVRMEMGWNEPSFEFKRLADLFFFERKKETIWNSQLPDGHLAQELVCNLGDRFSFLAEGV